MFQARFRRRIPSTLVKRVEKAVNKAVEIARGPKVPAEPEETSQAEQATAEMEAVQAAIQNGQELTARVARILAYRLADRIEELEAVKVGLDDKLAGAEAEASQVAAQNAQERVVLEARIEVLETELSEAQADLVQVATQNDKARMDLESRIEVLKAEKTGLDHQLADAKSKADRVAIQNNRDQIAYEARIEELNNDKSGREGALNVLRCDFEEIKSVNFKLESELNAAKGKAKRVDAFNIQDKNALRGHIDSLVERSHRLESELSACEGELKALKSEGSPETTQTSLVYAWRLFHKQEPTYAFVEAISVLECDLRQALGNPPTPDSDQPLDLYRLLRMADERGYISVEKQNRLNRMRVRRNQIIHATLQLTMPQAREDLDYLEQAIAHLGS